MPETPDQRRKREAVEAIAHRVLGLADLDAQPVDPTDIYAHALRQVRTALEAAYEAGQRSILDAPRPRRRGVGNGRATGGLFGPGPPTDGEGGRDV